MAVLGLGMATAGPAAATGSLNWRNFGGTNPITSSTSTWFCHSSVTIAADVVAQTCMVLSSDGVSVQAAVIVRNNRSTLFTVQTSMNETDAFFDEIEWEDGCRPSGVGAHSWAVCFGPTLGPQPDGVGDNPLYSHSFANNIFLGDSPAVAP